MVIWGPVNPIIMDDVIESVVVKLFSIKSTKCKLSGPGANPRAKDLMGFFTDGSWGADKILTPTDGGKKNQEKK